jgi:hypothetical protein
MAGMEAQPTTYRIILACLGIPPHLVPEGAIDIAKEFTHRPWHQNVRCAWDGAALILQAENDYDEDGRALMDEFSDSISAYISEPFAGDIDVRSITVLSDRNTG